MTLYRHDMKNYKAVEQYRTFKSVLLAIIAAIVLFAVYSKTAQDEESFKAEQAMVFEKSS